MLLIISKRAFFDLSALSGGDKSEQGFQYANNSYKMILTILQKRIYIYVHAKDLDQRVIS